MKKGIKEDEELHRLHCTRKRNPAKVFDFSSKECVAVLSALSVTPTEQQNNCSIAAHEVHIRERNGVIVHDTISHVATLRRVLDAAHVAGGEATQGNAAASVAAAAAAAADGHASEHLVVAFFCAKWRFIAFAKGFCVLPRHKFTVTQLDTQQSIAHMLLAAKNTDANASAAHETATRCRAHLCLESVWVARERRRSKLGTRVLCALQRYAKQSRAPSLANAGAPLEMALARKPRDAHAKRFFITFFNRNKIQILT